MKTIIILTLTSSIFLSACNTMQTKEPSPEQKSSMARLIWHNNGMISGHRGVRLDAIDSNKNSIFTNKTWVTPGTHEISYTCYRLYHPTSTKIDGKTFVKGVQTVTVEKGKQYFFQAKDTFHKIDTGQSMPRKVLIPSEKINGKQYYKETIEMSPVMKTVRKCELVMMPLNKAKSLIKNPFWRP